MPIPMQKELKSTLYSYLMYKPSDTAAMTQLCHINSFSSPDGGAPSPIYSKNLSERTPRSATGWYEDSTSTLTYAADYDLNTYKALKAMEGAPYTFGLWFGGVETIDASTGAPTSTPVGDWGKFEGPAELSVSVDGGETDGVRTMTITINKTAPWVEVSGA